MDNIGLTRHFKKRYRSRVGVKRKNQYKYISSLLESGEYLEFEELTGFMRHGISRIIDIDRYHPIITMNNIYIIANDGAYITLYSLPKEYRGKVKSLLKRKIKEDDDK